VRLFEGLGFFKERMRIVFALERRLGKMKKRYSFYACVVFICLFGFSFLGSQEQVDYGKILGDWDMEVDAGGEYYYLSFTIEKTDGELSGTISESSGFFTDISLMNIEFDGRNLSFEMTVPTPPDGYENLVKAELELVEERLEGMLTIESIGISASAVATKQIN
jgi:hypothetical protein